MNQVDGGQHERLRVIIERVFNQGQDGAGLVLGKEEQGAGGSRNRRITSSMEPVRCDSVLLD